MFQIRNAIIDHERGTGWSKIIRICGKQRPNGAGDLVGPVVVPVDKVGVAVFGGNAEVFAVPGGAIRAGSRARKKMPPIPVTFAVLSFMLLRLARRV